MTYVCIPADVGRRADAPRQWNGLMARDADRGDSNSSESGL